MKQYISDPHDRMQAEHAELLEEQELLAAAEDDQQELPEDDGDPAGDCGGKEGGDGSSDVVAEAALIDKLTRQADESIMRDNLARAQQVAAGGLTHAEYLKQWTWRCPETGRLMQDIAKDPTRW